MPPTRRPRGPARQRAAPARPNSAWVRFVRETRKRWSAYRSCRADLLKSGYSEPAVHDFRVAAQRLIASVRLVAALLVDPDVARLRRRVRKSFRRVRRLRDVQVMKMGLPNVRLQAQPIWKFRRGLEAEEKHIRKALLGSGERPRDDRESVSMRHVLRLLIARSRRSTDAALARALKRDLHAVKGEVQAHIQGLVPADLATFHGLRIALKHARYKLELVSASHQLAAAKAASRTAQGWQDLLGHIRDLEVLQDEIAALSPRGAANRTTLRVFQARVHSQLTEGIRTLLRQSDVLRRFGERVQVF